MDPTNAFPVPSDLPLPLPVDRVLGEAVLVLSFLAHILFINLMVGGSLLTIVCEIAGLKRPDFDRLAREIGKTITVNKSMAVVLGVAPLLAINVLYTIYFYSANALTGSVWIMIVPLVTAAFLVTYAHKYSWDKLAEFKVLHIAIGAFGTILFLLIPFIFLTNINLMLFPDKWLDVRGFMSAVSLPNVLPRYAHFFLASIAVTGLFLAIYFTRKGYAVEEKFETFTRAELRRGFYAVAFWATLAQFVAGPVLLFTLPSRGVGWMMLLVFLTGISLAIAAMVLLWHEILATEQRIGRRFVPIVALLTGTVVCMGYGRHLYREGALSDHRTLIEQRAEDLGRLASAAQLRADLGITLAAGEPLGQRVFREVCAACHMEDRVLVGPPLKEVRSLYAGNPAGLIEWTKAPGKKRAGFPQMPAFRLSPAKLAAVADFILNPPSEEPAETPASQPATETQPAATTQPAP
ncbi:MAG: cytochrome c [Phycisphaerae bacterium]|jgi:cytochrome c